jgi:hypothetical protein
MKKLGKTPSARTPRKRIQRAVVKALEGAANAGPVAGVRYMSRMILK